MHYGVPLGMNIFNGTVIDLYYFPQLSGIINTMENENFTILQRVVCVAPVIPYWTESTRPLGYALQCALGYDKMCV